MSEPLIVGGQPAGDSVEFEMDGDLRVCTIVMRPMLALEAIRVAVPFAMLKQTVAAILAFEAGQEAARLARLGQPPTIGLQHKQMAAQQIAKEAGAEIFAYKKANGAQQPGFDV